MSAANPADPRSLWLNSPDALLQVLCVVAMNGHDASNFSSLSRAFRGDEVLWGCIKDRRRAGERTVLMACSITGDLARVRWLLEWGADVNALADDGSTALTQACYNGRLEIVRELLGRGACVNAARTYDGWTPLMSACHRGSLEVVRMLLGAGADVHSVQTKNSNTSGYYDFAHLDIVCEQGSGDALRYVLISKGGTSLMVACMKGHLKVVRELLERGANLNATLTDTGWTSLMIACHYGHLKVVHALLGQGANVNVARTDGGSTSLIEASSKGHIEIVRELLGCGANVNAQTSDGSTSLSEASQAGHLEIVRELLGWGANVNARSNNGWTSLMEACQNEELEVVRELLGHGANVNAAQTGNGMNSLIRACQNGCLEVVRELLRVGADVNAVVTDSGWGEHGWTSLMFACKRENLDIAHLLLAHHASKAAVDLKGLTAYDHTPAANVELRALVKP